MKSENPTLKTIKKLLNHFPRNRKPVTLGWFFQKENGQIHPYAGGKAVEFLINLDIVEKLETSNGIFYRLTEDFLEQQQEGDSNEIQ